MMMLTNTSCVILFGFNVVLGYGLERKDTVFASGYAAGQVIEVCIAHGEGNYVTDNDMLARLEGENRVAFRYCDAAGDISKRNPNGSRHAIAGVYSENSRVLGMMPHPENLVEALVGGTDGLAMFLSLASAA